MHGLQTTLFSYPWAWATLENDPWMPLVQKRRPAVVSDQRLCSTSCCESQPLSSKRVVSLEAPRFPSVPEATLCSALLNTHIRSVSVLAHDQGASIYTQMIKLAGRQIQKWHRESSQFSKYNTISGLTRINITFTSVYCRSKTLWVSKEI